MTSAGSCGDYLKRFGCLEVFRALLFGTLSLYIIPTYRYTYQQQGTGLVDPVGVMESTRHRV